MSNLNSHKISSLKFISTNLIKCWKNVICKLNFCNGCSTCDSNSNTKANNSLFTQGGVENSIFTYKKKNTKKPTRTIPLTHQLQVENITPEIFQL